MIIYLNIFLRDLLFLERSNELPDVPEFVSKSFKFGVDKAFGPFLSGSTLNRGVVK